MLLLERKYHFYLLVHVCKKQPWKEKKKSLVENWSPKRTTVWLGRGAEIRKQQRCSVTADSQLHKHYHYMKQGMCLTSPAKCYWNRLEENPLEERPQNSGHLRGCGRVSRKFTNRRKGKGTLKRNQLHQKQRQRKNRACSGDQEWPGWEGRTGQTVEEHTRPH